MGVDGEGGVEREVGVKVAVVLPFQEVAVTMWRGGDLMEEPRGVCRAKVAASTGKAKIPKIIDPM